jgi:hypothetical protein
VSKDENVRGRRQSHVRLCSSCLGLGGSIGRGVRKCMPKGHSFTAFYTNFTLVAACDEKLDSQPRV